MRRATQHDGNRERKGVIEKNENQFLGKGSKKTNIGRWMWVHKREIETEKK